MIHYDHGMVGATVALAVAAPRRLGWPAVLLGALIGMFPDWDATPRHFSRDVYLTGHRVWGHNLFAVTLAGAALGGLGYWIHESVPRQQAEAPVSPRTGAGPWIVLGVLICWTHPVLDILYCGPDVGRVWAVAIFWPIASGDVAVPWMPSNDRGATLILTVGLAAAILGRGHSQRWACLSLALLAIYIGARGAMLPR
jgi:hypothetical protein